MPKREVRIRASWIPYFFLEIRVVKPEVCCRMLCTRSAALILNLIVLQMLVEMQTLEGSRSLEEKIQEFVSIGDRL